MKDLTEKQKAIFDYVKDSIRDSGYPPTVREIGEKFSITVKGAYDHLKAIEKKGFIKCEQNKSRAIEVLVDEEVPYAGNEMRIPLLGRIAAGSPIIAEENIEDYLPFPSDYFSGGDHFALHVSGDSMIERGIHDGDIAVIKKQDSANEGEIVAALVEDEATLKIFKRSGGKVLLVPANPAYSPIELDDVAILGKLAAVFRRY